MELVDLFDENRFPLGKTGERRVEREQGEYQTVVHVCLFNSNGELLLQRRAPEKQLWPELWDVSAAGGVDAGETSRKAAEREFAEELGYPIFLGDRRPAFTLNVKKGFDDFYILKSDLDINKLTLQVGEVSAVCWADKETVLHLLAANEFVPYQPAFVELLFAVQNGEQIAKR